MDFNRVSDQIYFKVIKIGKPIQMKVFHEETDTFRQYKKGVYELRILPSTNMISCLALEISSRRITAHLSILDIKITSAKFINQI